MNNTKENVEPEQDIGDAMQEDKPNNEQQEVEDHDSPPQSLPVQDIPSSSENENPLPKTDIASDDKNMEMECGPLPEPEIDKAPNDKKKELQSSPLPNTETETNIASNDNNVEFQSSSLPEIETNIVSSDKTMELQSSTYHSHEEPPPSVPLDDDQGLVEPVTQNTSDFKSEDHELPHSDIRADDETPISTSHPEIDKSKVDAKTEACELPKSKAAGDGDPIPTIHREPVTAHTGSSDIKAGKQNGEESKTREIQMDVSTPANNGKLSSKNSFLLDGDYTSEGSESGTEEEQSAFMKELEIFFRERSMDFKPPKFYGEGLNCLKLWRAVTRLGGYDKVTACKLWRQVGESFKPPKTCTTVSWTFRGFYEKALLDYERHKISGGELTVPVVSPSEPINVENQASGSGRARRDAAARAMQGWHSQRLLGNGEVSDPIIKDKNSISLQKRERQLKNIGLLKRKKPSYIEHAVKAARTKVSKPQLDTEVVDIGPPADWVKINVQRTKDCFEVYALVPGLLREEVRVQSDPAGRLVISGEPEHPDNPWGVTPFKKVVSLPSRIDPHQTSAVVTLHGQLFVRVPFEQTD